jgi:cold shock CspA family protein
VIGTCKFYNEQKHFGFIRYASRPGSDRLDGEVYFHDSSLRSFIQAGDRVAFELDENDGKPCAIDIAIFTEDRLTGTILNTGKRPFCFVEVDGRYGDNQRVFCAFDDVIPDVIGRRSLSVGARVSFRVESGRGGMHERAVEVRSELADIDPESYREFGKVAWYDADRGHIQRPCGDTLAFLKKNVITEGVETISVGTWLQYGIKVDLFMFCEATGQFRHRVFARDIAVCPADKNSQPIPPVEFAEPGSFEAQFLAADVLPLSEPTRPARLWRPDEMKLPLREIIRRRSRRKAAA